MKNNIILLLLLFCVHDSIAQGTRIWIGEKDGKVSSYPIDSIEKITFVKKSPPQDYDAMDVFSLHIIPYDNRFSPVLDTTTSDSLMFKADTLIINKRGYKDPFYQFPLTGRFRIDSITFSLFENDTNIVPIWDTIWDCTHQSTAGKLLFAQWVGNRIYRTSPFGYLEIDSALQIIKDSTYCPTIYTGDYINIDDSGKNFLDLRRIGIGSLFEYDFGTRKVIRLLKNIDSNISSAEYFNDDSILYYSYGPSYSQTNQTPQDAGYYFYDREKDTNFLILNYLSQIGPEEMVNGFDLSPDRKKLLIPVNRNDGFHYIIEYDFATGNKDTLPVTLTRYGGSLWLRYSHDGKKLLYDLFPYGTFGSAFGVFDGSETGIIDLATLSKKVINTNPTTEGTWITVFPQWSPDDKHIIYLTGSIAIEPPGAFGISNICILKKF